MASTMKRLVLACFLLSLAAPAAAQSKDAGAITTANKSSLAAWVTIYQAKSVVHAGCVQAGASRNWSVPAKQEYRLRAELTPTSACKPLPGSRNVACDTKAKVEKSWSATLTSKPNHCSWAVSRK